jgi:hypothetical protein
MTPMDNQRDIKDLPERIDQKDDTMKNRQRQEY